MLFEDIINEARRRKETRVAELPGDADLRPTIIFERNGQRIATVESPTMHKEAGLRAAHLGAQGYGADAITILLDAHAKVMQPGEALPAPGQLQKMCDEEGACDLDLITDLIIAQRHSRYQKGQMATLPYKYHGPETTFRWTHGGVESSDASDDVNSKTRFDGFISDCLIEALEVGQQNDMATAIQRRFGLDRLLAQVHADQATTITLEEMGFIVTEEKRIIDPTQPIVTNNRLIIPAYS
jgi:hypothetical protein